MVLSDDLCRFAGIKKEVVLTGGNDKFDIWSPEAWQQQQQTSAQTYEKILGGLGL
jgi:DNA-binding transcriptional regulator/RsmH inhibitor MraZ